MLRENTNNEQEFDSNYFIEPIQKRTKYTSTQKFLIILFIAAVILFILIILTAIIILLIIFFTKTSHPLLSTTPLLLISIDGFRHDYLEIHDPQGAIDISQSIVPNLRRFIQSGTRVKRMIPIYPSKTFPNHYSIVTGLYSESHGIISNNMFDPEFNATFALGNEESSKLRWWTNGEPFWKTVEKQNLKAASIFWPGSDGNTPSYYYKYDPLMNYQTRVDKIFEILDKIPEERASFLTTYFEEVDHAGHQYGPTSTQVASAMTMVDDAIGYLIGELQKRNMYDKVNIIIVSDHGMSDIDPLRRIDVDTFLSQKEQLNIVNLGTFVDYWSSNSSALEQSYNELISQPTTQQKQFMQTFKKELIPEQWHWKNNKRIAPIVTVATDPTYSLRVSSRSWWGKGDHGYLNTLEEMGAILFARGPNIKQGYFKTETFENVHIYPLMAHLLGVTPAANNGSLSILSDILKK